MPLYSVSDGKLSPIKSAPFLEKQIQTITENNLELVLGLKFVCSEFSVGQFRIDTLGFDIESSSFVIIEYKKDQSFSVIDQGYAYLSTMFNRKSDFILTYNEKIEKSISKSDIDWSQSRVIFISPSFTEYQIEASRFKDLPIELWKVQLYKNNTISYSVINREKINVSIKPASKYSKITSQIEVPTEEKLLEGVSDEVRKAYLSIRENVQNINPEVDVRVKKSMVCYYADGRGLAWVSPIRNRMTIWLRKGEYKDKNGNKIPSGWGNYPELRLISSEIDLAHIRDLLVQANEK